jgi:hypothetical protein
VRELLRPIALGRARKIAACLNGTLGLGVAVEVSPEGRVQVDIPRLGLSNRPASPEVKPTQGRRLLPAPEDRCYDDGYHRRVPAVHPNAEFMG